MFSLIPRTPSYRPDSYQQPDNAQQLALESAERRILVTGSAGTGKSQLVEMRINKLIFNEGIAPEKILWLTGNQRSISSLVKLTEGNSLPTLPITVHQYCTTMVTERAPIFNSLEWKIITPFEHAQLLKELIDHFPIGHPLKRYRGDVYHELKPLKDLFSWIKRTCSNIGDLQFAVEEAIGETAGGTGGRDLSSLTTSCTQPGEAFNQGIERLKQLQSRLGEFDNYQALLLRFERFDEDDLVHRVKIVFEENPALLEEWQHAHTHLHVDGLEQMNEASLELLQLLLSKFNGQLFVSLDENAALPGSPVDHFAKNHFHDAFHIRLTVHYRPFASMFGWLLRPGNVEPPGATGDEKGTNDQPEDLAVRADFRPVLVTYPSLSAELEGIVVQVQRLMEQGVQPEKIAVIFNDRKMRQSFSRLARLRQIPLNGDEDLLQHPVTKKLFRLLSYLAKELEHPYSGDELLFEMLHFDFFEIPLPELYRLTFQAGNRKRAGGQNSLRKILFEQANMPPRDLFDPGLAPALKKASQFLEKLLVIAKGNSLQQVFKALITEPLVHSFLQKAFGTRLPLLADFITNLINEASVQEPALDLPRFISIIELMEKEKLPLPAPGIEDAGSGINLLTVEEASGQEFDYVFVTGLTAASWEETGEKPWPKLLQEPSILQHLGKDLPDEHQQLYTALTRSKKSLVLSYASMDAQGKLLTPSFIIPALVKQGIKIEEGKVSSNAGQMLAPGISEPPAWLALNDDLVKTALGRFTMSASALNTWLDCPLGFFYRYILRMPSPGNEATEFGSAVHHALEQFFRNMQEGRQDRFPQVDFLLNEFTNYMAMHRSKFSSDAFTRRMVYGTEVLRNYHAQYHLEWKTVVSVELNITGVVVNGVPLKGKIDKLEFDGKTVNVVDYKSGDIQKAVSKLQPPNEMAPNGGDYWRQAVFYKILVDNYARKEWKVSSTEIDFIEPGKNGAFFKHRILPSPADVETVKQQLTLAWENIQQGRFQTGCGREHCRWCSLMEN